MTYQVRYPNISAKTGYSYATFSTLKEARHFSQNATQWNTNSSHEIKSVKQAVTFWLDICEKEGTDGREPVTRYTLKTYKRRAEIMCAYEWDKPIQQLTTPDIVNFRSWLLQNYSHYIALKTLSSFHTVLKELALRGIIDSNVANGVSIRSSSRYDTPVVIPSVDEVQNLLFAADQLAKSKNKRIAKTWQRYRPILYLAADTGMRPQEYLVLSKSNLLDGQVRVTRALERGGYKITVPKTRAGRRVIDVSDKTMEIISEYIERHSVENENDLIFSTSSGHWLQVEHWRNRGFNTACVEAGLIDQNLSSEKETLTPKYTPYSLRHFYASMLIYQNEDLKNIQRLMGHEKIETTLNTYGHLIQEVSLRSKPKVRMLDRVLSN